MMSADNVSAARQGRGVCDTPGLEEQSLSVLSVQYSAVGIASYSYAMRDFFRASTTCAVTSFWYDQEKSVPARVARRLLLLDDRRPVPWLRQRNLDFHWMRTVLGMACLGGSLARRKAHSARYGLLHFHTQSPAFLCVGLMGRTPSVVQTDMTAANLARERDARWRWTFAPNRWLDRRVFTAARLIVTWSEWACRSLVEDYGIVREKIRVIHPGVDLDKYRPRLREEATEDGPVRLLFAGYDFERKGGHDVLDVFLTHFSDQAELHLMTTTPVSCDHPRVFIHGGLAPFSPEWYHLYQQSDIFVMPTYRDGLPMVCVEAMAMGLPVVSTPIAAIPEAVTDGETGFLVSPGDRGALADSLRVLIENPPLRHKMGRKGREAAVARFNADTNFRKLEAVFREAAGVSATGGGNRDE